jgi:hypothetical protein
MQEVHLAAVIEILQSIRQSDMSPILSRLYGAPGGTEALDVLMKYMYVAARIDATFDQFYIRHSPIVFTSSPRLHYLAPHQLTVCDSYKGMAQASPPSNTRNITPQATGFSQVHSRGGGEGGGQAMSVLLSWHEKVCQSRCCQASVNICLLTLLAGRNRRPRLGREGHDRPTHCLSKRCNDRPADESISVPEHPTATKAHGSRPLT